MMFDQIVSKDLDKLGNRIIAFIKRLIINRGKNATGRTLKTLRQATELDTNFVYSLDIYGSIVFRYINDGRPPNSKLPPKGELVPWMRVRGIPDAAEFVIRKSIAIKGIEPFPVIDLTVQQINKQILGKASEQLLDGVSNRLQQSLRDDFDFPVIQI